MTTGVDNGHSLDVLYTDFSKAFDIVAHKRLLTKLKAYEIDYKSMGWIENFLSKRKQKVVMDEYCLTWRDVLSGVCQGSVLGPLPLLIYINDLPDMLANSCKLYADDSKVISLVNNKHKNSTLQKDIDSLT